MIYNIHYDISAMGVMLMALILILTKKGIKKTQNIILMVILVLIFIASFFDITSSIGNSYVEEWSFAARDFHNYVYLFTHNFATYVLAVYAISFTGRSYLSPNPKRLFTLVSIPEIVLCLVLFSNPIHRQVYYYDADKIYTHGYLFYVVLSCSLFYLFFIFYTLIRYGKRTNKQQKFMFFLFMIASVLAVLAQQIFNHVLLQLFVESLCALGMVLTVDNDDDVRDSITKCYNRKTFIYDFNRYLANGASFGVMIVGVSSVNEYLPVISAKGVDEWKAVSGQYINTLLKKTGGHADGYYIEGGYFAIIGVEGYDFESLQDRLRDRFEDIWTLKEHKIKVEPDLYLAEVPSKIKSVEEMLSLMGEMSIPSGAAIKTKKTSDKKDNISQTNLDNYREKVQIAEAVDKGLQHGLIEVLFEPIWDAGNNQISACELHSRLTDPILGVIEGRRLFEAIRGTDYIKELIDHEIKTAADFLRRNEENKLGVDTVFVKIPMSRLMDFAFPEELAEMVKGYGIKPESISLALEGNAFTEAASYITETMQKLHASGFRLAIDNYASEFTDTVALASLPVDIIRFGRRVLGEMVDNSRVYMVVTATIRLATKLNILVAADGVDDQQKKTTLQNLGCRYFQGKHFEEALPSDEFIRYCYGFNLKG